MNAIGLGEILWDLLPSGRQLGGAPANFAYHAQALGARAAIVSAVGDDQPGREIMARVRDLGLDPSHIATDPAHPTGSVSVTLDAAGVPSYVIHPNVAWDFIRHSDSLESLARQSDAVCFGSLAQRVEVSRETIGWFLSMTPEDSLRIFDINLRQNFYDDHIIAGSLGMANVLKINDEELPGVAELMGLGAGEENQIQSLLANYGLNVVALTRGSRGSSLYTPDGVSHHAGCPATIADTVGAGDAFTAALAFGLLRGHSLDRINERANRLASYVCSQKGATPPVPGTFLD